MFPLGLAPLLLVLSAPPATAVAARDAGAPHTLNQWTDGADVFVQLASEELELPGDEHCRAWVEVTAARATAGKATKVQLAAVRWTMDTERWRFARPRLVLDGRSVPARVLPREARGIETMDCAGLAASVGLELPASTVARISAAVSAPLAQAPSSPPLASRPAGEAAPRTLNR